MPYRLLRPLLFRLEPETAHRVSLQSLEVLYACKLNSLLGGPVPPVPCKVMGLTFPHPVGLAAGLDKNGEHIDALASLGFGFLEIGTVTPRPQPGNPRPRLFRLPEAEAIINRMGFNNDGVDRLLENVAQAKYRGILGINIGKNFNTPIERAVDDYLHCLRKVYARASYITVNISSPNTKDLRQLQGQEALEQLLQALKAEQEKLADQHGNYVPLAIKIAPDLDATAIATMAGLFRKHRVDAVIATNTTISRDTVAHLPASQEIGGLSGKPLRVQSSRVVRYLATHLQREIPIIGVGGIMQGQDAVEKINSGARLVQLYTGLIYRGPRLIKEAVTAIASHSR